MNAIESYIDAMHCQLVVEEYNDEDNGFFGYRASINGHHGIGETITEALRRLNQVLA